MIIYKITNKVNGKIYIGQTIRTLEQRKWQHLDAAKHGCRTHLYSAIRKYGEENFEFEVIDEASSIEELNELERYYIAKFDCIKSGYNMVDGGNNNVMFLDSVKQKHLESMRSDETRAKISKSMKQYRKEHPWTDEQRRKFAKSKYGNKNFSGHHLTPEHREAINKKLRKQVYCVNEQGEVVEKFNSVTDAAKWWYARDFSNRKDYYDLCNIIKQSNKQDKFIKGLKWIYGEEMVL
jgi:group I intron endonuclease